MSESGYRSVLPRFAGEFLTIVLGVLVALGVDEWRDNRAELRQEAEYYRSLVDDLDRDIAEYESSRAFMTVSIRAAAQVLAAITGGPTAEPFPTLAEAVQYASWVNYPSWSSGTLDELVNSGRIRLLRNQAIKRDVLAYYDRVEEWKPRIQGAEFATFIEYRRVTSSWLPLDLDTWTKDRSEPVSGEIAAFDPELEKRLRGNEQMLGLTQEMLWQWYGIDSFMMEFHDDAVGLRGRIRAELEGR